eukprot:5635461-Ditylum_brightwellii.AAC.1
MVCFVGSLLRISIEPRRMDGDVSYFQNDPINLSPTSEGSNPDIEKWDNVQSTKYTSAMPLAIEQ